MTDLKSLLIDTSGLAPEEIHALGMRWFKDIYLVGNGILKTHDGQEVHFSEDLFEHGFYTSSDWRVSSIKDVIDPSRVERVKWIKEFIEGNAPNSQCWAIPVSRSKFKRLYCSTPIGYVVWLIPRKDNTWRFRTAYPADYLTIRGYITQVKGSKRMGVF